MSTWTLANSNSTGAQGVSNPSSVSATFGSSVTAGNLIVACVGGYGTSAITVADSSTSYATAYTLAESIYSSSFFTGIYLFQPASGGASFTVQASASSGFYPILAIAEFNYSGGAFTISAESVNNGTPSSYNPLAGSVTPTASDLILAAFVQNSATGVWPVTAMTSPAFTLGYNATASSGNAVALAFEYLLNYSSVVNPQLTDAGLSVQWYTAAAAIKATGAAAPLIYPPFPNMPGSILAM